MKKILSAVLVWAILLGTGGFVYADPVEQITISGVVTDWKGSPISGVAVQVNLGTDVTDALGSYTITVDVADQFDVTASKEGYLLYTHSIVRTDQNPITHDILLNNQLISGTVLDGVSKPLANVTVIINGDETLTDENGVYTIGVGVEPEMIYQIKLVQNGFTYYDDPLQLTATDPVIKDIVLTEYYALTGRLLDHGEPAVLMPLEGQPNRVFTVHAASTTSTALDMNIDAQPDGTFTFISPKACDISVARQGQYMAASKTVTDCSTQVLPVDISLERAKVAVTVKDESGAPITRFEVVNFSAPLAAVSNFYISNTGEAVVEGFEATATSHLVTVKAEGYASVSSIVDFSNVVAGDAVPFTAVLKKGTINLSVKNVSETKVLGLNVKIDDPNATVTSNGQGTYTITGIGVSDTERRKILISGGSVYNPQILNTRVVSADPLSLAAYMCLLSVSKTGTVTGTIVETDGITGVAGAVVRVADKFAITSASGVYTLSDIPVGAEYSFSVEKKGYVTNRQADTVLFAAGAATEQTLTPIPLLRGNTITGTVTDGATGETVTGAKISVSAPNKVFVANDGSYIVEGVPSGTVSLSVSAPGYEPVVDQINTVGAGGQVFTSDILLTALPNAGTYQVSGTVISTRGAKIAGAVVTEPTSGIVTYTDEAGRFAISELENMPTQLLIGADGYTEKTFQLEYDNGKLSLDQSFVLNKSTGNASISGTVTESTLGEALAGATVYAYVKEENGGRVVVSSSTTTASGAFTLTGLEAGKRYTISATKSGYAQYDTVLSAGTAGAALALSSGGSMLYTILNAGGVALEGVQCYVTSFDRVFTSNALGQVLIDGLAFNTAYEVIVKGDTDIYKTTYSTITLYDTNPHATSSLTLLAQTSSIYVSGRVVDASSKMPIARAVVMISGYKTFSDAKGYYKLYGFTKGATVTGTVTKSGYSSTAVSTMIEMATGNNATVLDIPMEANAITVYGKVLNDDGSAMKDVLISSGSITTKTDTLGYYSFTTTLSTASVALTAAASGYQTGSAYTYFSKSATVSEVNFVLTKVYQVTVQLYEKGTGKVITSGTVYLLKSGDSTSNRKSAAVNYQGKAEIEEVVAGTYEVWATASGYLTPEHETVKVINADRTVELYLTSNTNTDSTVPGGTYSPPVATPTPTTDPGTEVASWNGFQDMGDPSLAWAADPVNGLVEKGVLAKADTFRPNDKVSREEFIKMLVMTFDLYDESAECNFKDASKSDWYYSYAASAYRAGIIQGYPNGTFGAGADITRQDMCIMAYRAAGKAGIALNAVNEAMQFTDDAKIPTYAKEAVVTMQRAGIINGMGDGTFAPASNATRAQSAKIMWGLLQLKQ